MAGEAQEAPLMETAAEEGAARWLAGVCPRGRVAVGGDAGQVGAKARAARQRAARARPGAAGSGAAVAERGLAEARPGWLPAGAAGWRQRGRAWLWPGWARLGWLAAGAAVAWLGVAGCRGTEEAQGRKEGGRKGKKKREKRQRKGGREKRKGRKKGRGKGERELRRQLRVGHAARDVMAVRGDWSAVGFVGMAGMPEKRGLSRDELGVDKS
jgi:hypothetical protein